MSYLVIGTKVNRPLRTKTHRDLSFTDCEAARQETFTKKVPDLASAERLLLDWVESGKVTFGTWEEFP